MKIHIYLIFYFITIIHIKGQNNIDLTVINKDMNGIKGVQVFLLEHPDSVYFTDTNGRVTVHKSKSNFTFTHPEYNQKTITFDSLLQSTKINLSKKQGYTELETVLINFRKPKIEFDELTKKIRIKHAKYLNENNMTLEFNGKHIVEQRNHKGDIDTLSLIAQPIFLTLPKNRKNIGYESNICLKSNVLQESKGYDYTLPFNSSHFLSRQLNYIDIDNLPFFENMRKYEFDFYEVDDFYIIKFKPSESIKSWLWSGYFKVTKDFYIEKIDMSLNYSNQNSIKIISSKRNKKAPSSKLFFKYFNVEVEFTKSGNNYVIPKRIEAISSLKHLIKKRTFSPEFKTTSVFEIESLNNKRCNSKTTINQFIYYHFYGNN